MRSLPQRIGNRVREARKRLGLTQAELADRLDMEDSTVRAIETGRRGVSLETLIKLREALNVPSGFLLDEGSPAPSGLEAEAARAVKGLPLAWQRAALRILREIREQVSRGERKPGRRTP